jgi:hypothetical protein
VRLDGALAGTTDARGQLLLSAERQPTRVELRHRDYEVSGGDVDAATGAPAAQERRAHVVFLRPRQ